MSVEQLESRLDFSMPEPVPVLRMLDPPQTRYSASSVYKWGIASLDALVAGSAVTLLAFPVPPLSALMLGLLSGSTLTAVIAFAGGYKSSSFQFGSLLFGRMLRGLASWSSLLIAVFYFASFTVSPGLLLSTLAINFLAMFGTRAAVLSLLGKARASGHLPRKAVVIGDYSQASRLLTSLTHTHDRGVDIIGTCSNGEQAESGLAILGSPSEAVQVIAASNAQVAIVTANCMTAAELRTFAWQVEPFGVELLLAPDIVEVASERLEFLPGLGAPLLRIALQPTALQRGLKKTLDLLISGILILFMSIPLVALCLAIRFSSPGPAFFAQERVGLNGSRFRMYKLRTMYQDAETRRSELLDQHDGNVVMFKLRDDPRVTRIGKLLRRFSLDEIPQLFNVIRGEMSLVGPRPPLPEEVEGYCNDAMRRLKVKPGLTGLWQVSGRSDLDWDETVRLDLRYVENWSIPMDFQILARTFNAVIGGRGAY